MVLTSKKQVLETSNLALLEVHLLDVGISQSTIFLNEDTSGNKVDVLSLLFNVCDKHTFIEHFLRVCFLFKGNLQVFLVKDGIKLCNA